MVGFKYDKKVKGQLRNIVLPWAWRSA